MKTEAASAGFYSSPWGTKHPRLQLVTIAELLDGRGIDYPRTKANVTFKKAPKAKDASAENLELRLVAEPAEDYRAVPPTRKKRSDSDQGQ